MLRPRASRLAVDGAAGNAIALAASRVIAVVGALALAAIVSRRLGSDGFGRFGAIAAAGFVANTVITFGTDTVVVRAVADRRSDARSLVGTALTGQLVASALVAVVAGGAFLAGLVPGAVAVQAVGLVPMAIVTVASAVLRGSERMRPLALAAAASAVASLLVALVIVDDATDVGRAVAALVIGQFVAAAVLVARAVATDLPAESDAALGGWWERIGSLASQTWVFAAMVVASAVSWQGVLALVATLSARRSDPSLDLGGLVASVRLLEAARIVPAAAFGAVLPAAFAGRWPAGRMRRWSGALVAYALAATAVFVFAGEAIVELVFGDVVQPGLIAILGLALVPIVIRLQLSTELLGVGRERAVLVASVLGAVVSLGAAVVAVGVLDADADVRRLVAAGQVAGVMVSVGVLSVVRSGERTTATGSDVGRPIR